MIKYIKIDNPQPAVEYLANLIMSKLSDGEPVVWLVPGGSALDIAIKVSKRLNGLKNLGLLTISLTDERYGPVGHADSNWKQLMAKGFKLNGAKLIPVLNGKEFTNTAKIYSENLNGYVGKAYCVALAGMGPDGHIFGIKPGSPSVNSDKDVVAYEWDDYKRITPTINLLKKLDEIVVYAVGPEKHSQIQDLNKEITDSQQPAQLLKSLPKVTIFNDYLGDSK